MIVILPLPWDYCPALRNTDWEERRPRCEATFLSCYSTKPKTAKEKIKGDDKTMKSGIAWLIILHDDNISLLRNSLEVMNIVTIRLADLLLSF